MKKFIKNLSHYGDILAIPFFLLLSIYFYNIENKNFLEYILYIFCISGFILDIIYTYIFIDKKY
jgi:tellurite resistance protein TehA-like permease